jgi:hypothetical protein
MIKNLLLTSFILLSILITQNLYSQSIKGKITDASNSDPLTGAIVKISELKQGAASDIDGNYTIDNLKPGSYTVDITYIGYSSQKIKDVIVQDGKVTTLNISLKIDGLSTEEINVESSQSLANEQSLLTEQKNSSRIQDGMSEQQIKRSPDATASDAIKRIIGVNIVDDKFVYIRGTSERYNNTTLNGVLIPSTEADRKSFSFDLFPAKLLENIIISKSFSPELPGNFSGGLVQLNTKDIVDQFTFNFETSGAFLTGTTSKGNFYDYDAGQKKTLFWLNGLDNGSRAIPSDFPSAKFTSPNSYGKSLNNNWQQNNNKSPLNGGFQLSAGNNFSLFNNPLGVLFAYTYKNGFVNETVQRSEYNSDTTTLVNYSGRTSNYFVLSGGLLNINYKIGDNNKFSFKNTTSISSDDNTRYYEGYTKVSADLDKKIYVTDFIERRLYSGQLTGSHYINDLNKMNLTWYLSYSESGRNEPDTKSTYYQRETGTEDKYFTPLSTIANANVGERFYSSLSDINRNLGVNFNMNFLNFHGNQKSKIKFGLLGVGTDRNFSARNFAPVNAGSFLIGFEPIDSIYRAENMDPSKLYYVETTDLSDQYTASEDLYAGYLMFDISALSNMKISAGLRYEYDEIKLNSYLRNTQTPVNVNQINNDILPAVNITYSLNEKTNLRASFSQTVSRPELREVAPFAYIDFVTQGLLSGNPDLKESLIQNYDLRYELFPDAGEIASLSLFYKHFNSPIEKVIVPTLTSAIPSYTFANATGGADNYGLEIELRKKLGFVSSLLNDFTLNANLILVNSEVNLEGLQTAVSEKTRRLQGQSPFTVNAGLYYDNYDIGLSTNLLFNIYGDKISEAGKSGFSDVLENGRTVMDFSVTKSFLSKFEAKFTARDLLNQDLIFTQDFKLNNEILTKTVRTYSTGTSYTLTLGYKF